MNTRAMKKKKNKPITIVITAFAITCLVVVLGLGFLVFRKYSRINKDSEQAKGLYKPTTASVASGSEDGSDPNADIIGGTEDVDKKVDANTGIIEDFAQLYDVNKDVKAWISIPNTALDQPVAQSLDNSYYLYRNIYKQKSSLGIPFIDYRATITAEHQSTNITIYGHAASNGTHFAPVKKYKDIEYYRSHPTLNFNTVYGNGVYKIIGFFMEDVSIENTEMFNYHDKVELDEEGFNAFISNVSKRSYFDTTVDAQYGDQLVCLSTCDEEIVKGTSTPYRVVLVARKLRDGESAKVDTTSAKNNTDMVMPKGWVSAKGKQNPYQ